MSSNTLQSGRVFGRWTLSSQIGEGGNGVVWAATDSSGFRGAIKFIKTHHIQTSGEEARSVRLQRFLDEIEFLRSYGGTTGVIQLLDAHSPERPSVTDRP